MKKILHVLLFFFFCNYGLSQNIGRKVLSSVGGTVLDEVQMDYTLGEFAITTITDGTTTLHQGFHIGSLRIGINIKPTVFLQGALLNTTNALMRDDLRQSYLPLTSPYNDALTTDITVFEDGGTSGTGFVEDDIVDWVFVEIRDKNDATMVKAATSALLQRDGDIVGVDGLSDIKFNLPLGDYYIAVKHRNHLSIMSASPISLSESVTAVNFTDANNQITFGSNAQTTSGMPNGIVAMWAGNVNGDTVVQYSGTNPDTPSILSTVLNDSGNGLNFPTFIVTGYNNNDVDMNGNTQYSGTTPDTPFILQNILAHPINFLNFSTFAIPEQLPEN